MSDTAHLDALELRLSHERDYLARAKTDGERALRCVWIAQVEREIADERAHLGLPADPAVDLDDAALLAALHD